MTREYLQNKKNYIITIVLISLGFCCFFCPTLTGFKAINDNAHEVAKDALTGNAKAFALVSMLKMAIAVIEGSEAGVGFSLEVGDAVQSIYDFVDYIWRILLYGLFILSLYVIICESGLLQFGLFIMGIGFFICAIGCYRSLRNAPEFRRKGSLIFLKEACPRAAKMAIFSGFLIAYLVPTTILLNQKLTNNVVKQIKTKNYEKLIELKSELEVLYSKALSSDENSGNQAPVATGSLMGGFFKKKVDKANSKVKDLADQVGKLLGRFLEVALYYAFVVVKRRCLIFRNFGCWNVLPTTLTENAALLVREQLLDDIKDPVQKF